MKYYLIQFSHSVRGRVIAETEKELSERLLKYLRSQNQGEAKSDRLYLVDVQEVSKEKYNQFDSILIGSLNDYDSKRLT